MLKLLQSIFGPSETISKSHDSELIERAIDRVIDGTDPRLRAVSGYRKRLRPVVTKAVEYTFELVDELPAPIALSRKHYSQDDYIRSFFASPDHISQFLTQSLTLQDYLANRSGLDPENIHALLTLTRRERKVLGMKLDGELLRRDVAQVSITFSDLRLSHPMDDEDACHIETKKAVFNYFVELALKNLIALRGEQQKIKQQRKILTRKLRTLESTNWGIGSLFGEETDKSLDLGRMEQKIDRLEAELNTLETTPVTLDKALEAIVESLSHARDQLWKTGVTLKLNRMGIKIKEDTHETALTLHLNEYCSPDGRKVIALPIYVPFDEIPAKPDFLAEASRYL